MKRSPLVRPSFPFLGASLLLFCAAAVCAISFTSYLAAVFLGVFGLICLGLSIPTPEPIPVTARGVRRR